MKKILKILSVILISLSLFACASNEPNAYRSTEHKYDFKDFIDISVFGSNGNGFIEIAQKELKMTDFDTEQEYINVKKALDELDLNFSVFGSQSQHLKVSKASGLSTGDVVVISVSTSFMKDNILSKVDINLEDYEYVVPELALPEALDLFSPDNVIFYGLKGTNEVYAAINPKTSLPEELTDNLVYTIYPDSQEVEAGKTILDITVELKPSFLDSGENPYGTFEVFLGKHNYYAELEGTKVLEHVVEPIDFSKVRQDTTEAAIYEAISTAENEQLGYSKINKVSNIQQLNTQKVTDPYAYLIIYKGTDLEGNKLVYRRQARLAAFNNQVYVLKLGSEERISDNYLTENYDGAVRVMDFNIYEAQPETPTE